MPGNYEQSRRLHGIGASSSGRGMKRPAEQHLYDQSNERPWKRDPYPIPTPDKKPKKVGSPFDGFSSSSSRTRAGTGNPTAKMTAVNTHVGKRLKANATGPVRDGSLNEGHEESRLPPLARARLSEPEAIDGGISSLPKYRNEEHREYESSRAGRAIPSVTRGVPGPSRSKLEPLPSRELRSTQSRIVAPFVGKSKADNISMDEPEPEMDRDSGPVNDQARSRAESEGRDEMDLFNHSPEEFSMITNHSALKSSSRPARDSRTGPDGVILYRSVHEDTVCSSRSSLSRDRPRRLAEDGDGTKRLGERLRGHIPLDSSPDVEETSNLQRSPLPLNGKPVVQNLIEEIEESDFRMASSSRRQTRDRESSLSSGRDLPPETSSIPRSRVVAVASQVEKQSVYFDDLRKAGRQKTRVNSMKGKSTSTARGKLTASYKRKVSSKDKQATAGTSYNPKLALPLEICFWGTQIFKSSNNDPTQPEFWLWWNNSQLQLHRSPLSSSGASDTLVQQIDSSVLRRSSVTISASSDMHVLRVELKDDLEMSNSGLMFKAQSQHPNIMKHWNHLTARLNGLLAERGKRLLTVKGRGVLACLEAAQKAVEVAKQGLPDKQMVVSRATQPAPSELADAHKEPALPQKRQPRPRPAHGKNHDQTQLFFGMRNTRHSSRLSAESAKQEREEQPPNLDEIILIYGAVNVTSGDLRRLEPSEFLNDSLIELGLKFWLHDLRERQPELAESIHVFSSFFFKKLASKSNKTPEDGYKSVRKWTAKVDIFKKKYIIVPINENMHWYLALIYHPENILEPAPPKPPPRISQRASNAASRRARVLCKGSDLTTKENLDSRIESRSCMDVGETLPNTPVTKENDSEAEAEVEELIDNGDKKDEKGLRSSPPEELPTATKFMENKPSSIIRSEEDKLPSFSSDVQPRISTKVEVDRILDRQATANDAVVDDSLSENTDDEEIDELDDDDPTIPQDWATPMDVDVQSTDDSLRYPTACSDETTAKDPSENTKQESRKEPTSISVEPNGRHDSTIPATSFYGATAPISRTYQDEGQRLVVMQYKQDEGPDELDVLEHPEPEHESSEELEATDRPRTIIFGMDSLGSSHPKALSQLNEYLQEEAKDKKGVPNPSPALTKKALVPTQPNFCDCGLYLLHFAQTFINDPEKYKAAIFSNKRSSVSDRNILWRNEEVGAMRDKLKERIIAESTAWKTLRAEKDKKELDNKPAASGDPVKKPLEIEESDDEIEVSEVRHVGSPQKKPTKRAVSTPAARLR